MPLHSDLTPSEAHEFLEGIRELRESLRAIVPPKHSWLQTWGPTILGCILSGFIALVAMRDRLVTVEAKNAEQDRQIERIDQIAGKAVTDARLAKETADGAMKEHIRLDHMGMKR